MKYALILIFSAPQGTTSQIIQGYSTIDDCKAAYISARASMEPLRYGVWVEGATCVPMPKVTP